MKTRVDSWISAVRHFKLLFRRMLDHSLFLIWLIHVQAPPISNMCLYAAILRGAREDSGKSLRSQSIVKYNFEIWFEIGFCFVQCDVNAALKSLACVQAQKVCWMLNYHWWDWQLIFISVISLLDPSKFLVFFPQTPEAEKLSPSLHWPASKEKIVSHQYCTQKCLLSFLMLFL